MFAVMIKEAFMGFILLLMACQESRLGGNTFCIFLRKQIIKEVREDPY